MRAAVSVPVVGWDREENIAAMVRHMKEASENRVDLLLFPETVITGLINGRDFSRDRDLGLRLDSNTIRLLRDKAIEFDIWLAFGLFELCEDTLYDSALLIDRQGEIALHYRRFSPGWRLPNVNPESYGLGEEYMTAETPWGKIGFLICGDLFDVPHLAKESDLDLLLFPFARCFPDDIATLSPAEQQAYWDHQEWPQYAAKIAYIGAPALMTNYIADPDLEGGAFGGGYIVDMAANILTSLPLYQDGIIVWEME